MITFGFLLLLPLLVPYFSGHLLDFVSFSLNVILIWGKKGSKSTLSQFNRNYSSLRFQNAPIGKYSNIIRIPFCSHFFSICFFLMETFLYYIMYIVKNGKFFFLFIFLANRQYFRTNTANRWEQSNCLLADNVKFAHTHTHTA